MPFLFNGRQIFMKTRSLSVVQNYFEHHKDIERLQNYLKNICNWCADWLMFYVNKRTYEVKGKDLEEISEAGFNME